MKLKNKEGLLKSIFFVLVLFAMMSGIILNKEKTEEQVKPIELPKVYFEGDITNMLEKSDVRKVKLTYKVKEKEYVTYSEIKIQGTSSLAYEKKNYTITLYEDDQYQTKKDIDVGFGKQHKYTLKANWIDKTHARNIVSARLAGLVDQKYGLFLDTPNYGKIDGFPVEIYSNGEFLGLYTWNIPKDAWMFHMDEDNENHIVLSSSGWSNANMFKEYATFNDWEVEVGEESETTLEKFNRVVGFIKDSTDEEFKNNFNDYLNLDATLNYYILVEFLELYDNTGKNMLMATYDGNVWYPTLYDLDTSFGTDFTGYLLIGYDGTNISGGNLLFDKLVRNFPNEIKERYQELRKELLTKENILNLFYTFEEQIPASTFEKEREKWGENLPGYSIEQIEDFLDKRIVVVDRFIENLNTEQDEIEM